ncbi:MAG: glycosyltransferase family 2 protein [Solirubrobacterales bacterium]|nr:glycosyltransferase family 2 protein [Solirubrobacterales bacterium]
MSQTVAVVPNRNGARWLPGLLDSIGRQTLPFTRVIVVDDASTDGSRAWLAEHAPHVQVVALVSQHRFAAAVNAGLAAVPADADAVALLNTDVVLAPRWHERMSAALTGDGRCGAVAGKLVSLHDPGVIDDAGDVLRRDGVCEQRGRGHADDGRFDTPGELFGPSAAAALYRRTALTQAGGLDARYGAYLEDVDLALRLGLAGWRCRYVPGAVARHAGGGSTAALGQPVAALVARNTLLLVARYFPWRWAPFVLYRQVAWLWHAARGGRGPLREHLGGLAAGVAGLPSAWRGRRAVRRHAVVPIAQVVPARPWRGPDAGGHPRGHA